jgi:hypothetical protein
MNPTLRCDGGETCGRASGTVRRPAATEARSGDRLQPRWLTFLISLRLGEVSGPIRAPVSSHLRYTPKARQPMTTSKGKPDPAGDPRSKVDPPVQPVRGDDEDATSGSEGGGPRIGYSENCEADRDRHQFPHPQTKPRQA